MPKMKMLPFLFSFLLALSISSPVNAEQDEEAVAPETSVNEVISQSSSQFPQSFKSDMDSGQPATYEISDIDKLEEFALERGLNEVPEKVEYEFVPNSTNTRSLLEESNSATITSNRQYWAVVNDQGTGWFYSNNPYRTFTIDGPDTFVYTESAKTTTQWNGTFGMDVGKLKAQIGFANGEERTVTFTSNTPVAANQRLNAKLFVTYKKLSYAVYYGPVGNIQISPCTGTGYAWEANGTLIEKTFTAK